MPPSWTLFRPPPRFLPAPGHLTCCSVRGRSLAGSSGTSASWRALPRAAARPEGGAGARGRPGGRRRPGAVARMAVGRQAQYRRGARPDGHRGLRQGPHGRIRPAGPRGNDGDHLPAWPVLHPLVLATPGGAAPGPPEREYQQARRSGTRAPPTTRPPRRTGSRPSRSGAASSPPRGGPTSPARRVAGWQGLLTVNGASLLAERPVLIADLSGQHCARAHDRRPPRGSSRHGLPHAARPGPSGLLAQLPPAQLANAIAEAVHGGGTGGPGGGPGLATLVPTRLDVRVLQQLAGVLAGRGVTPRRRPPPSAARWAPPSRTPRCQGALARDYSAAMRRTSSPGTCSPRRIASRSWGAWYGWTRCCPSWPPTPPTARRRAGLAHLPGDGASRAQCGGRGTRPA